MNVLDMSYLCHNWTVRADEPTTLVRLPSGKDLTLSLICENAAPHPLHPIRILSARIEGAELWSVDLLSSGELLVGERRKPPRMLRALGGDRLQLSVSYSPASGGFALCANNMQGEPGVSMSASNIGKPVPDHYELVIGRMPTSGAEMPPLDWSITARHELAAPILSSDTQTSRTASVLVEVDHEDTLRVALDSIEHWLSVARSALAQKGRAS